MKRAAAWGKLEYDFVIQAPVADPAFDSRQARQERANLFQWFRRLKPKGEVWFGQSYIAVGKRIFFFADATRLQIDPHFFLHSAALSGLPEA